MAERPPLRQECHLPFWTPGSGHYGDSLGQNGRRLVSEATPFLLSWIDSVPVRDDGVFTIADIGCSDGYSTLSLYDNIIRQLRKKHREDLPIQIIYEDQEKNDYNSLFMRIADDTSPFTRFSNVYPMATNINFYKQCVPDGTCDVIFTSYACQWLEYRTTTFKDCVFFESASQEELERICAEAERDWAKFLTLRARELKPGGLLLALVPMRQDDTLPHQRESISNSNTDQGRPLKEPIGLKKTSLYTDILLDMEEAWKDLKDDKIITQEEYERCIVGELFRTPREITSPFDSVTSPVRQAGLILAHLDDHVIHDCMHKAKWQKKLTSEGVDDRNDFAQSLVNGHRVWSQTSFQTSLLDSRSEEQKVAIMEGLYERMKARVLKKDPATYRSDVPIARLVARKM